MRGLGPGQVHALMEAARLERYDMSLCTGGPVLLRHVLRLEDLGYLERIGPVVECDGDGFALQPERYRDAWKLTKLGRDHVAFRKKLEKWKNS